ncbi:proton-associated sugar transporter A-like [Oppia nitens]|uniref:proton-associated sugar transporter A-like n=1 Tax=Oppia nitens TaxID=1686743 RepID=UPI0023DCA71C|nr:proton-associated sugar transporter A-like [Oppia nitens]
MDPKVLSEILRPKTRKELIMLSSIVCGLEFCYSAETAFVIPTLLTYGIPINNTTIVWCLSPLLGLIVSPLLGSLSDSCKLSYGRRRPFILLYSLGIILGLILVPNSDYIASKIFKSNYHSLSVFMTIFGAVLLDFCCDACQSPSRTLLFEVTNHNDYAIGLSTFTLTAGFGGGIGYLVGSIDWENIKFIEDIVGSDHKRIVFLISTFAFITCLTLTLTSFQELPFNLLPFSQLSSNNINYEQLVEESHEMTPLYSSEARSEVIETVVSSTATFSDYIYSIIQMPTCLRILCLTNLFSWMSLICYSLYFTDFVAQSIFNGNPTAPSNSESYKLYETGVKFGCLCMTFYSMFCSLYSYYFETLLNLFGAKFLYIGSGLIYSIGMLVIAITRSKISAIVLSFCAGIQYSTLFTMPYVLIAKYRFHEMFSGEPKPRGLGTDIAVVGSMVFLAQFILSLCMGTIIDIVGSHSAAIFIASFLSACSAGCATKVYYINQ